MNTWTFIHEKLSSSTAVILLYVVESRGSSPGRRGFHMAVAADDSFHGTIGGGIMEIKFVEMAKAKLLDNNQAAALFKQVHDKSAAKDQSGMICSGEQTILLYSVHQKDKVHIAHLLASLEANGNGTLQLSDSGLMFSDEIPVVDYYFKPEADGRFRYIEKTGFKNRLHIIGGGHCGLALSRLMSGLDFYITLYDDRENLSTMQENNDVHEKRTVASYADLGELIEDGENVYVVIMTVGYRTDAIALRALQDKHFRYIGMLGSKQKINKMLLEEKQGISPQQLFKNVSAPVGIRIKSQTAFEIAISIAAEIIAEKNKDQ